jgi:hypothetical protein
MIHRLHAYSQAECCERALDTVSERDTGASEGDAEVCVALLMQLVKKRRKKVVERQGGQQRCGKLRFRCELNTVALCGES